MEQLLSTTNAVRLSFVLALLRDASIPVCVFDAEISALTAGIGVIPRRVMVSSERLLAAKILLKNAQEFYNDWEFYDAKGKLPVPARGSAVPHFSFENAGNSAGNN